MVSHRGWIRILEPLPKSHLRTATTSITVQRWILSLKSFVCRPSMQQLLMRQAKQHPWRGHFLKCSYNERNLLLLCAEDFSSFFTRNPFIISLTSRWRVKIKPFASPIDRSICELRYLSPWDTLSGNAAFEFSRANGCFFERKLYKVNIFFGKSLGMASKQKLQREQVPHVCSWQKPITSG